MTPLGPTAKEIADYEREVRNSVCHFCGEPAKNNCNSCGTPLCSKDTYIEEYTRRVLCEDRLHRNIRRKYLVTLQS